MITVPRSEPELDPILMTIPLQVLAYHIALGLGHDVDKPRNLTKSVTVERRDTFPPRLQFSFTGPPVPALAVKDECNAGAKERPRRGARGMISRMTTADHACSIRKAGSPEPSTGGAQTSVVAP